MSNSEKDKSIGIPSNSIANIGTVALGIGIILLTFGWTFNI